VRSGTIIRLRPTIENTAEFLEELKAESPETHQALTAAQNEEKLTGRARFPETPTLRMRYPTELVRAYYLLGRSLGATKVAGEIQRHGARP
jgi:hypothetical protein